MDQEEDRLYLEQACERLLRHLCGRLTGLLRQLCGGLNGVLEHNRRVREAQRRARLARPHLPWREQQAQVWYNLNQRYERMLEHDRRVREAQAQRLREEQAQVWWKFDLF